MLKLSFRVVVTVLSRLVDKPEPALPEYYVDGLEGQRM